MRRTMEYERRFKKHFDELKWLYCELYHNNQQMFEQLCSQMESWYQERDSRLKALDRKREKDSGWYKK